MEQETEYFKLPLEERCVHKSWRARLHGYEECVKTFQCIDDEKSPEWNKFLGFIKKFVVDNNAAAQEKGLEAVLAFVENAAVAAKTVSEVLNGIVTKCIAAPKAKTKELAVQIILMYIEIEKHEATQEELLKGTEAKNPKIVSACIAALTLSIKEFGPKVINVKPLIKKIPAFLEDRDKTVREEGKAMAVEIYRWIGPPLKQQLNSLKPVHVTELEAEFSNLSVEKAIPTRYLKSQKPKMTNMMISSATESVTEGKEEDDDSSVPDVDPYELLEPVDILSKLPKDFYDKVEAKKWQERKEALEILENLVKNPKLENGDYGELVKALKKIIAKDTNVLVVALAVKCLAGLAGGLKKRFQPYAIACLSVILEKFREKKQNVVQVLREAADAIFLSITVDVILEDTLAALENKNPAVKAETAAFLARCFARTPPASLNKKLLKAYSTALLKTLNESDPTVRDNSAEALGTAMKLVGEKTIMPFLNEIDNLKMAKIKECAEKAVIIVKIPTERKAAASERPNTAPAKVEPPGKSKETEAKNPKRPNTAATKKSQMKKSNAPSMTNLATTKKSSSTTRIRTEKNYSNEEIDEMAAQLLPSEIIAGLVDSNWKTRLGAVDQLSETIKQMDPSEVSVQVLIRALAKKPGYKDTNFQVLKQRLEVVKFLAENYPFSNAASEYCIMDITEKLGDAKNGTLAADTLLSIAESMTFEYVATEVITFAFNQKNPKVQQEALMWLCKGLTEFGCVINVKSLMATIKKAVAATNPGIRSAAIALLGTLYLYAGRSLMVYFENEKPALKQQIEEEFEKHSGETPPAPIRGVKNQGGKGDCEENTVPEGKTSGAELDINDLITRVDISTQITESLLNELADKNWKVRNEGLQKITTILNDAKFIKGSIGDLPQSLALRLVDSNSKIAQSTLNVCQLLATAMGPPAKQYVRALFPGFVQCLGDSKNWIRTAAVSCINTWGDQCGYKEFFDGEMVGDALKSGSPQLRVELWNWMAEKLPLIPVKQIPKEELMVCLPHLYNNLEDRNSDVRKNAQEAILGFMIHLSYETMARNLEKLKPGSRTVVLTALEKARPNLPVQALPKKHTSEENAPKSVKSGGAIKAAKTVVKPKGGTASKPNSARKKDEDIDTSPLLAVNNLKHQRVIDEQKLKLLKWNFTTPREEFVDLLKELMSTANVNKTLMANMFHSDFRYHIKAIESLTEDLPNNSRALVSNLDLILKWLTLRFFDTNPSVLLKGLDYLQSVFNLLIEDEYHMLETEAASFIPYLIIKIGDPKDAVRNGVRALFKQIALVYPVSKLFSYIMEGLKSKNARQRTECLDQLGSLIENYGVCVCQPSPSVALREVAKQIADRDNCVRNAALNCIVQAYFLEGDKINKLIGQISEKDQSLLDERIKRAAKNRPLKSASATRIITSPVAPTAPLTEEDKEYEEEEPEEPQHPTQKMEQEHEIPVPQLKVSGPYGLDMDFIQQIESAPTKCRIPTLIEPDLSDLSFVDSKPSLLTSPKTQVIPISPPKLLVSKNASLSPSGASSTKENSIECNILGMASLDLQTAIHSMISIENLLKSHQVSMFQSREDKFINAVNMQLKLLQTYPLHQGSVDVAKCFRSTFLVILVFYDTGILGKNVPLSHLKELVDHMICLLVEDKLNRLPQALAYYRVINNIVVKIIDNSDHTTIICALIKLLHGCAESNALPKYEDLVMKCLWKIVKMIPNWAADLNYDAILLEVHRFFKDYPSAWWKKRKSDTPSRTVKTLLHGMTKVKGSTILSHLTQINDTNESELHYYLLRLIATVKPEEISRVSSKSSNLGKTPKHLSKFTHQQLSEIFKKIGSKHHTQEGLVQLYDFKLQYPEADVQPFLVKSHQFFQDFIEQGLKDIDMARKNQNLKSQETTETSETDREEKNVIKPMHALEKHPDPETRYRTTNQSNKT